jgi:hypothetical protein
MTHDALKDFAQFIEKAPCVSDMLDHIVGKAQIVAVR